MSLAGTDPVSTALIVGGATDAQREYKAEVNWRIAYGDPQQQAQDLDELLASEPDVLVFESVDTLLAPELHRQLMQAGLPLIALNISPVGIQADLYLAPDYRSAGIEMGRLAQGKHHNRQPIILFGGESDYPPDVMIGAGITSETHGESEFKPETVRSRRGIDVFQRVLEIYRRGGQRPGAIIAVSGEMTKGVVEALHALASDREIQSSALPAVIGIDYGEETGTVIPEVHLIDFMPYASGARIIERASQLARGGLRHPLGSVFRRGDLILPADNTPHRIVSKGAGEIR